METTVICEKILQIINNILKENNNDLVVEKDDVINVPFTIDGTNFNEATILDSFEIVSIIVEIENEFQIEIDDDDMLSFKTINDLVNIVKSSLELLNGINNEEEK